MLLVTLVLLGVKLAWLCIDPTLRLYLGDSLTYLQSAALLTGSGSRSFLYGWALHLPVAWLHSPVAVIAVQGTWSLLSCLGLFVFLRQSLGLGFRLSAAPAVLLATEPAQVFLERMVMAETLGLLAFVVMLLLLSRYLGSGRLRWYFLGCLAGLAAAAFRMNFLPVALGLGLVVPLVRALLPHSGTGMGHLQKARHVALALAMLLGIHLAYVHLYGHAAQQPPGYLAHSGRMQIGLVAPLIRPEHFEGTGVSGNTLDRVRIPLDDHWQRSHHIWDQGGLWSVLETSSENPEQVARTITRRALLDDPAGLLRINVETLGGYFDQTKSRWKMLDDKGARIPGEDDLRLVRIWMGWDARGIESMESPARRYFAASGGWLVTCLLALPLLALITSIAGWRQPRREQYLLLGLASLGLFAGHLVFAHIISYRYIHPFPWFVLANVAAIIGLVMTRWQTRIPARPAPGT
ncbi:hypothetical protein [Luteimonas sp. R10]|uniref:hypothetical protein n=1 Tax=Luteimonas sp. R10 TaxID=3108176 RepID=UPI00308F2F13|nr:hypothetical protein U3649_07975 [Luteimonas sp. R10]